METASSEVRAYFEKNFEKIKLVLDDISTFISPNDSILAGWTNF